jgi:hypothetical protein
MVRMIRWQSPVRGDSQIRKVAIRPDPTTDLTTDQPPEQAPISPFQDRRSVRGKWNLWADRIAAPGRELPVIVLGKATKNVSANDLM